MIPILLMLVAFQPIPSNSYDWASYLIPMGGGEVGYELTDVLLSGSDMSYAKEEIIKILVGVGTSYLAQWALKDYITKREGGQDWAETGRWEWTGFRVVVGFTKALTRPREEKVATMERLQGEVQ